MSEDLKNDAQRALLEAIITAAPTAAHRATDGLESLARAFAYTVTPSSK